MSFAFNFPDIVIYLASLFAPTFDRVAVAVVVSVNSTKIARDVDCYQSSC